MALLDKVRVACRTATTDLDGELLDLIAAALADLGITDINADLLTSDDATIMPLVRKAVLTYCKMNFGTVEPEIYADLKEAYETDKAQMSMSSPYTVWGGME